MENSFLINAYKKPGITGMTCNLVKLIIAVTCHLPVKLFTSIWYDDILASIYIPFKMCWFAFPVFSIIWYFYRKRPPFFFAGTQKVRHTHTQKNVSPQQQLGHFLHKHPRNVPLLSVPSNGIKRVRTVFVWKGEIGVREKSERDHITLAEHKWHSYKYWQIFWKSSIKKKTSLTS